jgi:hypothetical protein
MYGLASHTSRKTLDPLRDDGDYHDRNNVHILSASETENVEREQREK